MEDLSDIPPTDINPYEILQVDQSASPSDVKTAYKKLALKHHPGMNEDRSLAKKQLIKFQTKRNLLTVNLLTINFKRLLLPTPSCPMSAVESAMIRQGTLPSR